MKFLKPFTITNIAITDDERDSCEYVCPVLQDLMFLMDEKNARKVGLNIDGFDCDELSRQKVYEAFYVLDRLANSDILYIREEEKENKEKERSETIMEKFIIIKEEAHGIIGYAPTYVMAIRFLVNNCWFEENPTREEVETLLDLGIKKFNKKYDGQFELEVGEMYYGKKRMG